MEVSEANQKQAHIPYDGKPACCDSQKKCCSSESNTTKQQEGCCKKPNSISTDDCCKNTEVDDCCDKKLIKTEQAEGGCCSSQKKCEKNDKETIQIEKSDTCCASGKCSDEKKTLEKNKEEKEETITQQEYIKWVRIALALSLFTIIWNICEGIISLAFGFEEETIALSIFGADSLIEVASGFVVFWRFNTEFGAVLRGKSQENTQNKVSVLEVTDESNIRKERIATRIIGVLLIFLAIIAIAGASINLAEENGPDSSLPGLLISGISISFMFFLYYIKKKAAFKLNKNKTLLADAKCSLSCIVLSLVLFAGSLVAILTEDEFDGWWIDSVITIIMAILIAKEGAEAFIYSFSKDFQGGCGCCRIEEEKTSKS